MRINSVSTLPVRQITNTRTNLKYKTYSNISFGISDHERRVREKTNDLTKNMGFFDKHILGGKAKANSIDDTEILAALAISPFNKLQQYTAPIDKCTNNAGIAPLIHLLFIYLNNYLY